MLELFSSFLIKKTQYSKSLVTLLQRFSPLMLY